MTSHHLKVKERVLNDYAAPFDWNSKKYHSKTERDEKQTMIKGDKTKNDGMIQRVLSGRQHKKDCDAIKSMNAAGFKTVLMVLPFFVLMALDFSEAQVPNEHKTCTSCHIEEGSTELKSGINETCISCHPNSPGRDHPVGIAIKDVSEKLPLDRENKITCVTCHEPHGEGTEGRLLRMEFNELCILCHKN